LKNQKTHIGRKKGEKKEKKGKEFRHQKVG
jgi:hypothetical protein